MQYPILDTVIVATLATGTAVAQLVMADPTVAQANEIRALLLPLIGSLIVGGGVIMLNPEPETKRIVIGRSLFALVFGVVGPQLLGLIHPAFEVANLRPGATILLGGIIAAIAYVLSRPACKRLYESSDRVVKEKADQIERKYINGNSTLDRNTQASDRNTDAIMQRVAQENEHPVAPSAPPATQPAVIIAPIVIPVVEPPSR